MLGAVVAALVLLSGCATASESGDSVEGAWGSDEPGQPQLTLEADGKLHGTDGCNRMIGTWELEGERVILGPIATTMMACPDVETWLSAAESLEVEGAVLHVFDQGGVEIGTLPRQGEGAS